VLSPDLLSPVLARLAGAEGTANSIERARTPRRSAPSPKGGRTPAPKPAEGRATE
jgi:hypothetical protein